MHPADRDKSIWRAKSQLHGGSWFASGNARMLHPWGGSHVWGLIRATPQTKTHSGYVHFEFCQPCPMYPERGELPTELSSNKKHGTWKCTGTTSSAVVSGRAKRDVEPLNGIQMCRVGELPNTSSSSTYWIARSALRSITCTYPVHTLWVIPNSLLMFA